MEENLRFIYKKEFWYISAFINTNKILGETKAEEIETLLLHRLKNLTEKDLKITYEHLEKHPQSEEKKNILAEMAKSIDIECDWEPYFQNFPYTDESTPYTEDGDDLNYNTLGYFKFEVEYYKDEPFKKEQITPDVIQQIPFIVLEILKKFKKESKNQFLLLDTNSPIYVFVISNKTSPIEVQWNPEEIKKYKKNIAPWVRIHSGQWDDYNEDLFNRRIKKNFSNRKSELHYIQRNSGFVYMAERNFLEFSYIQEHIIESAPKIRAILFALMTINNSLDVLFMKRYSEMFIVYSLDTIEKKTSNLRFLRGMIQTKMTLIYNQLDWNRREHYTRVLRHLIKGFRLEAIIKRTNDKFKMLYDSMQELYLKRNEENQKRTKRAIYYLDILLGAGFVIEFAGALLITFGVGEKDVTSIIVHGIISLCLGILLILTLGYSLYTGISKKSMGYGHTVDAVIEDENKNIILVKRRYSPFKGKYALPGGFINYNEDPEQAVIREVREETNLVVEVVGKIGTYNKKGRDPREKRVESKAFKCRIVKNLSEIKGGDDATAAEAISPNEIKVMDLAFDHKKILQDAGIFK
ncbi:MAG: NUDIX domain-containing protein [Promethearchaeota archaeon]|jgi:8-oxo-dGTP diphosphatase